MPASPTNTPHRCCRSRSQQIPWRQARAFLFRMRCCVKKCSTLAGVSRCRILPDNGPRASRPPTESRPLRFPHAPQYLDIIPGVGEYEHQRRVEAGSQMYQDGRPMLDCGGGGGGGVVLPATTRPEARDPFKNGGVEVNHGGRSSKKRVRVRVSSMISCRARLVINLFLGAVVATFIW